MCRLKKRKEITINNTSAREENDYPSMELQLFTEKTGNLWIVHNVLHLNLFMYAFIR